MGYAALSLPPYDDYLRSERAAPTKHEYVDGRIVAMAGASMPHNMIVGNLIGILFGKLKGSGCRVFPSDMRLHIPETGTFNYPDVMIVCGKPELLDEEFDTLMNPTVIIEVLSESTADYDRGSKFARYRTIGSLREYLTVDSRTCHVEYHARETAEAFWALRETADPAATVPIRSVGAALLVAEVYDGTGLTG